MPRSLTPVDIENCANPAMAKYLGDWVNEVEEAENLTPEEAADLICKRHKLRKNKFLYMRRGLANAAPSTIREYVAARGVAYPNGEDDGAEAAAPAGRRGPKRPVSRKAAAPGLPEVVLSVDIDGERVATLWRGPIMDVLARLMQEAVAARR